MSRGFVNLNLNLKLNWDLNAFWAIFAGDADDFQIIKSSQEGMIEGEIYKNKMDDLLEDLEKVQSQADSHGHDEELSQAVSS